MKGPRRSKIPLFVEFRSLAGRKDRRFIEGEEEP